MHTVRDCSPHVSPALPQLPPRDVPWQRDLQPAVLVLIRLGYTLRELERAYAFISLFGTVECCPFIEPGHRREVEAALPRDPAWAEARWDELAFAVSA